MLFCILHFSQAGVTQTWESHEKIPTCSLRTLLTRFLDITSAPSRQFLTFLSGYCEDNDDKERMEILATETDAYEDWRHNKLPHLLEVFNEFPSCKPPAALFVAHLMTLQPRFYSISSSQKRYPNEVHLTVAIVKYQTNGKWKLIKRGRFYQAKKIKFTSTKHFNVISLNKIYPSTLR